MRKAFYLLLFVNLVVALPNIFSYRSVEGVEANVVFAIQNAFTAGDVYTNSAQIPYAVSQYMPGYYMLCSCVCSVVACFFDIDCYAIFVLCRLVSTMGVFCIAVCIFRIAKDIFSLERNLSLLLAILAIIFTNHRHYLVRPDVYITLFTFLSIYMFMRYQKDRKVVLLILAGALAVFPLYFKQNGLIIAPLMGLFLLANKNIKGLGFFLCGYLFGHAILGGVCFSHISGEFFLMNVVDGVNQGFSLKRAMFKVYLPYLSRFSLGVVLTLLCIFLVFTHRKKHPSNSNILFLIYMWFFISLIYGTSALKMGSGIHYFSDSMILSLLIIAGCFPHLDEIYRLQTENRLLVTLVCILLSGTAVLGSTLHIAWSFSNTKELLTDYYPYKNDIVSFIEREVGDNVYFISEFKHLNLRFPKNCAFPQYEIQQISYDTGRKVFGVEQFKKDIDSGKIRYLIGEAFFGRYLGVDLREKFTYLCELRGYPKAAGKIKIYINKNSR
ncbi:glycosyltransferase family 39 protein [Candidatus Uabimicrobium amorphum]|nr:glycosyltransferase family 39 protein [Candidatus Uabimicrobium amorphum]